MKNQASACIFHSLAFRQPQGLHTLRRHFREKAHLCEICTSGFDSHPQKVVHMRRHIGERPFSCLIFSKGLDTKVLLNRHELIYRKDTLN